MKSSFTIFRDLAWAEEQTYGSPLEKLMMLRIVSANAEEVAEYGFIKADMAQMARYCCTAEVACYDALRDLERRGYLEVVLEGRSYVEVALPWWANSTEPNTPSLMREYGVEPRAEMLRCQGGLCWYCGEDIQATGTPHLEHQVPKVRGGRDILHNLVLACGPCNFSKGSKTVAEFRQYVIERDRLPKTYRFHGERQA